MKIYRDKFYVLAETPGISGFKRYGELEFCVVTGYKAVNERARVIGQYLPTSEDRFILCDGHMPHLCPQGDWGIALDFLSINTFQRVVPISRDGTVFHAGPKCCATMRAEAVAHEI